MLVRTLAFSVLVVAWLIPSTAARAQLVFGQPSDDFGQLRSGQCVEQEVLLVNQGSVPAEISELKGGCSCLRPVLDAKTLKPGEKVKLLLKMNALSATPGKHFWN